MGTKSVNGEKVNMTAREEADIKAEWPSQDNNTGLRDKLLRIERDKAIEMLIANKRVQIEAMNTTALQAAIDAGGLS